MTARFSKLRKRNVYVHHYTEYMELEDMDGAAATIQDLAAEYGRVDARAAGHSSIHRASWGAVFLAFLLYTLGEESLSRLALAIVSTHRAHRALDTFSKHLQRPSSCD